MIRKQAPRISAVGLSIKRAVKENPGIHFRGLGRAANVTSAGQLRHHLDRLEHQGILIEVEDGRYKRFFFAGDQEPSLRAEMARFARVVPRRIAKLLLVSAMNRTQLRRSLGCADSTLGYHLTRMVVLGDLTRTRGPNSTLYSLANRELVSKILLLRGSSEYETEDGETAATDDLATNLASTSTPDVAATNLTRTRAPGDDAGDGGSDDDVPNPLRPRPGPPADVPSPTGPEPDTDNWRAPMPYPETAYPDTDQSATEPADADSQQADGPASDDSGSGIGGAGQAL